MNSGVGPSAMPLSMPRSGSGGDDHFVRIDRLDRRARGLSGLLAHLVRPFRAGLQSLLAVPERDRHALAAIAIDQEVGILEPVDLTKSLRLRIEATREAVR